LKDDLHLGSTLWAEKSILNNTTWKRCRWFGEEQNVCKTLWPKSLDQTAGLYGDKWQQW